jgi:hypothetical protein
MGRKTFSRTSRCLALSVCLLSLISLALAQELKRAAFVGVRAGPLTDEARARLHFTGDGVLVLGLVEGGSARDAGLQTDDVITQVNEHKVYGTSDYVSTVADDPYLADIINSFHPGRATLKAIPGMDHYLTKAASMEESMKRAEAGAGGEFEPAVLDAVRDWLAQQAR